MSDTRLSLATAIEQLQTIADGPYAAGRPMRLVIRKKNPGGMTGHQTTEVKGIFAGFDREAGRVIIEPEHPLTELTAEQVEAIVKSVRDGTSWHAYQREKTLRERIATMESDWCAKTEVAALHARIAELEAEIAHMNLLRASF